MGTKTINTNIIDCTINSDQLYLYYPSRSVSFAIFFCLFFKKRKMRAKGTKLAKS